MKVSVSLRDKDLDILDRFVEQCGLESRSAGIQQAIQRLPDPALEAAYAAAWEEWIADGGEAWESTTADGLSVASR